jgi:hypothetical protein
MQNSLESNATVDDNTLMQLILLMLLGTKGSEVEKKKLVLLSNNIMDKYVKYTKIPEEGSMLFGDSMFYGHVYDSSSEVINDILIQNNLPF